MIDLQPQGTLPIRRSHQPGGQHPQLPLIYHTIIYEAFSFGLLRVVIGLPPGPLNLVSYQHHRDPQIHSSIFTHKVWTLDFPEPPLLLAIHGNLTAGRPTDRDANVKESRLAVGALENFHASADM